MVVVAPRRRLEVGVRVVRLAHLLQTWCMQANQSHLKARMLLANYTR